MSQDEPEYIFIKTMKEMRQRRGWSQERLAEEVEAKGGLRMNPTAITKLEWALDPARADRARGLRLNESMAIAEAFGTNAGLMATLNNPELDIQESVREAVEGVQNAYRFLAAADAQRALAAYQVEVAEARLRTRFVPPTV